MGSPLPCGVGMNDSIRGILSRLIGFGALPLLPRLLLHRGDILFTINSTATFIYFVHYLIISNVHKHKIRFEVIKRWVIDGEECITRQDYQGG